MPYAKEAMMHKIKWLSILLSISLGANFWFLWVWYENGLLKHNKLNESSVHVPSLPQSQWKQGIAQRNRSSEPDTLVAIGPDAKSNDTNQAKMFKALQTLVDQQNFETLSYEVRDYLRLFPNDSEALLLEAQAYFHTRPLNQAIVHYQSLLSLPLTKSQYQQIQTLIKVNTTRVMQQFTGDGAWDLLAKFLEPLVQVDPLNRQYILGLARAYGMQGQDSLMENVLAALDPNDPRAERLREKVSARLNSDATTFEDKLAANINANTSLGEILGNPEHQQNVPDLVIQQSRGQFISSASIKNIELSLLLDTGASTTAISDTKFNQIPLSEVEFLGQFTVNTAGGSIQAPIYKIKQFQLGKQTLINTSVLILPSNNLSSFDGLLGMNVLSQFDLAFDANSETVQMFRK